MSLEHDPPQLDFEQGDKYGHLVAYAILMLWFANFYEKRPQRLLFAGGFVALGVVLEFVQGWTGYRTFEIADMAGDACGVVIGWLLAPPRTPNCLRMVVRLFEHA